MAQPPLLREEGNYGPRNPTGPANSFSHQKTIFAANWITRGFAAPDTVPKFDWRTNCPPVTANCAVRIEPELVRLKRLKKLNASKINCSFAFSWNWMSRVIRGSKLQVVGNRNVLRPTPGTRSFRLLPSLLRS